MMTTLVLSWFIIPFTVSALSLTPNLCKNHDNDKLYATANSLFSSIDKALVPSHFKRVAEGYLITIEDESDGVADGGGTNTFGAYGSFYFPNGNDIFPPGMCNLVGHSGTSICDINTTETLLFPLGPVDAIAFYGCTPPPMKYFSYDAYIGTRITEEYPFYPGQNFGDSISHYTINVTNKATSVFNQPAVIIHSADAFAADMVSQAFVDNSAGAVTTNDISIRGIGNPVRLLDRRGGKTWQEVKPDVLFAVSRYSVPDGDLNNTEYKSYKASYWPVRFYFADDEAVAVSPMEPTLRSRYTNQLVDEVEIYLPSLDLLADSVISAFSDRYNEVPTVQGLLNYTDIGNYDNWDYILDVLKDNSTFVVGTRDALYGSPLFPDGADGFRFDTNTAVVLIGIQHTPIQRATYSSIGVDLLNLVTGHVHETHWFLDSDLIGSAQRYLPADTSQDIANAMFAIDVLPYGACAKVPVNEVKWCYEFGKWTDSEIKVKFPFVVLGERIYCLNDTLIGPAANVTLSSRVIVFNLKT